MRLQPLGHLSKFYLSIFFISLAITKLNSFAHIEFNNPQFNNLEKIKSSILNKKDLFDRAIEYKDVKIDNTFPIYIQKNIKKFEEWII